MLRAMRTIGVLFALFALGAISASSADAVWFINGAALTGEAALLTKAHVVSDANLTVPALGLRIECVGEAIGEHAPFFRSEKPEIIATSAYKARSLLFDGCNTAEPVNGCDLQEVNETISTNAVVGSLTLSISPQDRITLSPQSKATLANIFFSEANLCAFWGEEPVKGSVTLRVWTGQEEKTEQAVEGLGSSENNSLEIGGQRAYFSGGDAVWRLVSNAKWSFR
jgi:hypothetical protein